MTPLSFLRKQEPITTGVCGSERYLSFLLQRGAAEYGSRIALRLSGTTTVDFRFDFSNSRSHLAARCARVMHECFAQRERAWGMPGAQCTRSLACEMEVSTRGSHHELTRTTRHSRTQWF